MRSTGRDCTSSPVSGCGLSKYNRVAFMAAVSGTNRVSAEPQGVLRLEKQRKDLLNLFGLSDALSATSCARSSEGDLYQCGPFLRGRDGHDQQMTHILHHISAVCTLCPPSTS